MIKSIAVIIYVTFYVSRSIHIYEDLNTSSNIEYVQTTILVYGIQLR